MALSLEKEYRSAGSCLGIDFFARVLPASRRYYRAAGFFSSSVFTAAGAAWETFFVSGGRMQLVCSDRFSSADAAALRSGVVDRPRWRRREWKDIAAGMHDGADCAALLSWLVAHEQLAIKIARVIPAAPKTLYHEKIGVFEDAERNSIAVTGSANETWNAWAGNFERVDTFRSWGTIDEAERCKSIRQAFDSLWLNRTAGLEVLELQAAVLADVLRVEPPHDDAPEQTELEAPQPLPVELLVPPASLQLFKHQSDAIEAWARAQGTGILEMATGAGKTLTALSLASRLYDAVGPGFAVLLVAPYLHLVDQWVEVSRRFGLRPIRCAESVSRWQSELGAAVDALNAGRRPLLSIVTTSATLASQTFATTVRRIRKPFLVIGDEVHNYGARALHAALPSNAAYRLGLSATPDRWMDLEGTSRLREYFGDVVFEYTLSDAIRQEILTPYRYYPYTVALDDEEFEQYLEMSFLIARYMGGSSEDGDLSDAAKTLLIKRARLVASARAKLPLLAQLLQNHRQDDHILIYCGDGSVEGRDGEAMVRQVAEVARLVGQDLGMRCATYTAETPLVRRHELLKEFDAGFIQVLIAIRCLDEGVDVPSTRTAIILASSTNPRQFVQRRGRVLRRYEGKRRAEIYDVFVRPPVDALERGNPDYEPARALVRSQVRRAAEFASLAENGPIARRTLTDLLSQLHLLDTWESET